MGMTLPSDTLCADSYLGIKEIFRKREEVKHSQCKKCHEINNLDESCKEIERENSKTPTKTVSSNKQKSEDINSSRDLKINRIKAIQRRKPYKGESNCGSLGCFRLRKGFISLIMNVPNHILLLIFTGIC